MKSVQLLHILILKFCKTRSSVPFMKYLNIILDKSNLSYLSTSKSQMVKCPGVNRWKVNALIPWMVDGKIPHCCLEGWALLELTDTITFDKDVFNLRDQRLKEWIKGIWSFFGQHVRGHKAYHIDFLGCSPLVFIHIGYRHLYSTCKKTEV